MKKIFIAALLLSSPIMGETVKDISTRADQFYKDGFKLQAWKDYRRAFLKATDINERMSLIHKITSTASDAGKRQESLAMVDQFFSQVQKQLKLEEIAALKIKKALIQVELKMFKEAYKECLSLEKSFKDLTPEVSSNLIKIAVYGLIQSGKQEEASNLIEKYREKFANQEELDLQNARLKIVMSQYVNAITILGKYNESKNSQPHFLALWAYLKSGDTEKAYEIFNKHLKDLQTKPDPAYTGVIIKLAESTFKDKNNEATLILDKVYQLENDVDLKAYIILKKAELQLQASMDEEAIKTLELFLQAYPKSNKILQARLQLAELYFRSKKQDVAKAEGLMNSIIDANPGDKELLFKALSLRADLKMQTAALPEAAVDYSAAAELAKAEKFHNDRFAFPMFKAGVARYMEAGNTGIKEAYNDAANHFYSAASVKSACRSQAALMQIQALRNAESFTMASKMVADWLKIFPSSSDLLFLQGISLLEGRKTKEGINSINRFIRLNPGDPRVAMAYVYALKASIYAEDSEKFMRESEKLIINFESLEKRSKDSDTNVKSAAPYITHLKAVFAWKNNYRTVASNLWENFLTKYPTHPLSAEVYLWLAYEERNLFKTDYSKVIQNYESALTMLGENSLKAYTQIQLGKSNWKVHKFEKAAESLESAVGTYKKLKLDEKLTEDLANLYFFLGDLYSRMGRYEDKAVPAYNEAEKLSSNLNTKMALKGRVADCLFSAAVKIRNLENQQQIYLEKMREAIAIYKEISTNATASKSMQEQALYKLAKTHETLGNLGEKSPANKDLADAHRYYHELFFGYRDDVSKGLTRDPYFFCRAGYDLARLQLSYDEKDIQSAISTYEILANSGFTGTADAKAMVGFLKEIQKNLDK